jgi:hypothetical protein
MNRLSLLSLLSELRLLFTVSHKGFEVRHTVTDLTTNLQLNIDNQTSVIKSAFKRVFFLQCGIWEFHETIDFAVGYKNSFCLTDSSNRYVAVTLSSWVGTLTHGIIFVVETIAATTYNYGHACVSSLFWLIRFFSQRNDWNQDKRVSRWMTRK